MSEVQCKFEVTSIQHFKGNDQCKTIGVVTMSAVKSEPFGKYTPCGQITMTIQNDLALNSFEVGKEYNVNFSKI